MTTEWTFHLLRPWWLLAVLPALWLGWHLLRQQASSSRWAEAIDPALLPALLDHGSQAGGRRTIGILALLGWLFACIALAGPCFTKSGQKALKQADALVILLDLSPSMMGNDIEPSRLKAAHYKILDLLRQRREGYTGLVAFAGSAHVVSPLSDDAGTIAALVTALEPGMMPLAGSRPEDAVSEALQLLANAGFQRGRLLLLTDSVVPAAVESIQRQLGNSPVELHVIGIGTETGSPIPLRSGKLVTDAEGRIVVNRLDEAPLIQLASQHGGTYSALRQDDSDIAPLIAPPAWLSGTDQRSTSHTLEHWHDSGYWLVLPCLLLVLPLFRRGAVLGLAVVMLALPADPVQASAGDTTTSPWPDSWRDWWQTPDQQGAEALSQGDAATAAERFRHPQWKGYAQYESGQHAAAARQFALQDDAAAHYNRGNALARAGDLQGAIEAYDHALALQPDLADARFNRDLVRSLLDQQPSQTGDGQPQDSPQEQQQEEQQGQDQQGQDQQGQQQQGQQQDGQQQPAQEGAAQAGQEQQGQQGEQGDEGERAGDSQAQQQDQQSADQQAKDPQSSTAGNPMPQDEPLEDSEQDGALQRQQREQQQAAEQWLRKVPDDPGGLLRNKFEYYYQLHRQQALRQRGSAGADEEEPRW